MIIEAPAKTIRANNLDQRRPTRSWHSAATISADDSKAYGGRPTDMAPVRNGPQHAAGIPARPSCIGQAAYTSHYSVGLDVRSGLEDAEALAELLTSQATVDDALRPSTPRDGRKPRACSARRGQPDWFEQVDVQIAMPFEQFVFSLLTASMRMTYARIEKAAPELVSTRRRADRPAGGQQQQPAAAADVRADQLRELTFPNRVVVSPMCMYSAKDGTVNDFHLVHLGSRAVGGAGLVVTEMTECCRKAASACIAPACIRPSTSAPGSASSISSTRTATPRSRSSSRMPAARAR